MHGPLWKRFRLTRWNIFLPQLACSMISKRIIFENGWRNRSKLPQSRSGLRRVRMAIPTEPEVYEGDYRKHFKLKLYVYSRPNLRDDALEYEMYMGMGVLKNIFDNMKIVKDESLFLSFPERWLNIIEQRQLYYRLIKYRGCLKRQPLA